MSFSGNGDCNAEKYPKSLGIINFLAYLIYGFSKKRPPRIHSGAAVMIWSYFDLMETKPIRMPAPRIVSGPVFLYAVSEMVNHYLDLIDTMLE